MAELMVEVEVHEATETLHTSVSREIADDYYLLPESLVDEWEQARARLTAAENAISAYIETHGLELSYVDNAGPAESAGAALVEDRPMTAGVNETSRPAARPLHANEGERR